MQQLPLTQTSINQYGEKEIEIIGEFYGSQKVAEDGNVQGRARNHVIKLNQ